MEQSDKSMWDFVKSKPATPLLAQIVNAAIDGVKQKFANVDALRLTCKLHEDMSADWVVTNAGMQLAKFLAAADALGLDPSHPDFIENVRGIKAFADMTTASMARTDAKA
jgi:hypothetical protein